MQSFKAENNVNPEVKRFGIIPVSRPFLAAASVGQHGNLRTPRRQRGF